MYFEEPFTDDEKAVLSRFFTNTDGPVYALVNLPEVVKGALFARYSRSPKSVRRLFLDEFVSEPDLGIQAIADQTLDPTVGVERAEKLYERVFSEYGDDSVAQLGAAHLACEQSSNVLTKILERGRLASYLEQSTRYIFYDQKLGADYRYFVPQEVTDAGVGARFSEAMDGLFDTYSDLVKVLVPYYQRLYPKSSEDSNFVYRSTIRAKACDTIRGLLPAATISNVGVFASGQAYEALLLRMRSHPLAEARDYSGLMLEELRKVIPAFLRRVDVPDRGGVWSEYLAGVKRFSEETSRTFGETPASQPEVTLLDWDEEAETKIVAAGLYAQSDLPDEQLLEAARQMSEEDRAAVFRGLVGERTNRRHRPGRGFERADYRFDLLTDFGIFRDLQRHRMLTIDWQRLGVAHGYVTPDEIGDAGVESQWHAALSEAAGLVEAINAACGPDVAQYAVPFAYRIRYNMQMNAREAMHLLELRTVEGGHPDYRRVCQQMHTLIRDKAGHRLIADAMKYVDYNSYGLDRLETERRAEQRRNASGVSSPDG
ncbi:MAG: FAD-dependent thymidylate synthase [Chloroflexi bacterium]|nr:FAD-dependent thymidylate synthase [Chloroflexota bacterium]